MSVNPPLDPLATPIPKHSACFFARPHRSAGVIGLQLHATIKTNSFFHALSRPRRSSQSLPPCPLVARVSPTTFFSASVEPRSSHWSFPSSVTSNCFQSRQQADPVRTPSRIADPTLACVVEQNLVYLGLLHVLDSLSSSNDLDIDRAVCPPQIADTNRLAATYSTSNTPHERCI